jgi:hypothetical protein
MKEDIKEALDEYVRIGRPTGDFLRAVLSNNLAESFGRADMQNRHDMFEIVNYVYNELPGAAWGSPEKVKAWLKRFETAGVES